MIGYLLAAGILNDFKAKGYHQIQCEHYTRKEYQKLYALYDWFLLKFQSDTFFRQAITNIDTAFEKTKAKKLFANAPIGFRHTDNHGKSNKTFIHYAKSYGLFIEKHYPEFLKKYPRLQSFLNMLDGLNTHATTLFKRKIEALDPHVQNLKRTMYHHDSELVVITKVVAYEKCNEPASHPHYDFSGLTFIVANDDNSKHRHLLVSPFKAY